jgi:hypothetical protein
MPPRSRKRQKDERVLQHERTTGQCCRHRRSHSVVADVDHRAERVCQFSSGRLVVPHVVKASGGQVQDGLLHDNGDKAIFVVPHHISSVAASLFVAHHPCHHHPCRPRPRFHHRCRRSLATLITVAIALAALFIAALIIDHALLLFVVTRCRARVHRQPSTLPLLVDCCLFTPAVAVAIAVRH